MQNDLVKGRNSIYNVYIMKNDLWNYLKQTQKPIVLYGMGNGADKIINELNSRGISFSGVFASDGFVRPKEFHGFKVTSYSELKTRFGNMIVLLCFGSTRDDVLNNIKKIAATDELYAPDVPVFGETIFDLGYAKQNASDLEYVYNRLADDISRLTFKNTVLYKLTGNINYLFECEIDNDEPYRTFFSLKDNETFMDLGAYRGDTVKEFIKRVNDFRKIYAVEPDKKTFIKLLRDCADIKKIEYFNACISEKCGKQSFKMNSSRGSSLGSNGEEIDCYSIDGLLNGNEATLIKMDIEGEELSAIKGAEKTILNQKPRMQISCYHRSEDLTALPKAVMKIRDDYKIYMRHTPSLPAWDTYYYFV